MSKAVSISALVFPMAIFSTLFINASCSTSPKVVVGAERIRVFEVEPKGCLYIGEVSSVQENVVIGPVKKKAEMDLATRIDLRNKAHELGGNVLVFFNGDKAATSSSGDKNDKANAKPEAKASAQPAVKQPTEATVVDDKAEHKVQTVFLSTVFRCPSSVFNQ